MKSAVERKREERKRKREQGLIQRSIWIKPERWELIQYIVSALNKP